MQEQKEKEFCPHCGAQMTKYRHALTPALVGVLQQLANEIHRRGRNDIHIQTELNLDHNEYNNFQKLRYFGLVHHADKSNTHSGRWLLTTLGGQFLRAEAPSRTCTITFRNEIDHEATKAVAQPIWIFDFYRAKDRNSWQKDFAFTLDIDQGRIF